ncbi:MMPL family transporter [Micromonospora chersina]|uniref:MMPL family transporter n=1 Tax=Micromonospora chersina TaxID=47854 RepID=UPI0036BDC972
MGRPDRRLAHRRGGQRHRVCPAFGTGTDYTLLLISRYRDELRRTSNRRDAMTRAVRGAAPAVIGSAATVILALLTLLAAVLTSNRTLGVSAALGVGVALFFRKSGAETPRRRNVWLEC